ncbi:MAG: methylenetetrahydrofolate reductase, partial [Pseudomonadota bacterium]|nr:methylenetetrahydrofolate reductase [Pseudomonadota bacterium]
MCAAKPTISFEYFPPKSEKGLSNLLTEVGELVKLRPRFMTVTYGAGGSTREGTIKTVKEIWNAHKVPTGSHLTYLNTTKEELDRITDDLWDAGIRHIVALRGDMPADLSWPLDPDADYYQFTSDFVEGIRERHPFEISVGAYPEKHPDSPDLSADILALK